MSFRLVSDLTPHPNPLSALEGDVIVSTSTERDAHHHPYNTLVLSSSSNETGVELKAGEDNTHFVLIAGEPLDQPVVQYGPFGDYTYRPQHNIGCID